MIVLAVDTAGAQASVALNRDGECVAVRASGEPRAHASHVLALVEGVLDDAGLALESVDRFAFGRGPGGLTGLRVAASVVQGFAFVLERPVVAVSNLRASALQALAQSAGHDGVLVVHDAGLGQLVCGHYGPGAEALGAESLCAPGNVAWRDGRWLVAGNGAERLVPPSGVSLEAAPPTGPLAVELAALAGRDDAEPLAPEAAQPVYLRHPVNG